MTQLFKLSFSFLFILIVNSIFGQSIKNGPMLGYLSMREASVWVQTNKESKVQLRYWTSEKPTMKFYSQYVITNHAHAYTATLVAEELDLGVTYNYDILVNGIIQKGNNQTFTTKKLWKWRADAPDYTFLAGSCAYINETPFDRPGTPYGSNYGIFSTMAKENAQFMIWLGDNTYLREADWDSKSGIYSRFTHTRNVPTLGQLLKSKHHYAIWDDHDYGPNDSDGSYYLKDITLQAFKDFWPNNNYGAAGNTGITSFFDWSDGDFYLLDDRYNRTPIGLEGEVLGKKQIDWLCDALQSSSAKFKFIAVGSQVLSASKSKENLVNYPKEFDYLIQRLDELDLKGIIFLTGDRHFSEVSKLTTAKGNVFYDFTVSPLTSGYASKVEEVNSNRVDGSLIFGKHNYATFAVTGPNDNRQLTVTYKDATGTVLATHIVK
jgi:alkaline phosphatase D